MCVFQPRHVTVRQEGSLTRDQTWASAVKVLNPNH